MPKDRGKVMPNGAGSKTSGGDITFTNYLPNRLKKLLSISILF
jgi:hypothetical protein